jgi:nucleotide-binding universal stress UspA family protein
MLPHDNGKEDAMYKHILIPTDGFSLSNQAIRQGVVLAKSLHARVTDVTVSPTFHTLPMKSDSLPRRPLTPGTVTLGEILEGDQELAPSERKPLATVSLRSSVRSSEVRTPGGVVAR